MDRKERIILDDILNGDKIFYRNISVDNVIFGYHERELKVLLFKNTSQEKWLLPGGYVKKDETLEKAAHRVVRYRTNLKKLHLHQFFTFSNPERNKNTHFTPELLTTITGQKVTTDHWLLDNFISVAFFTLVDYYEVKPTGSFYAEECQWWDITNLPEMAFDHREIIDQALLSLRFFSHVSPIGKEMLPEKFTIPELQSLYETILGKKLDNRNFVKKMTNIGLIEKLDEKRNIGKHRSPFLYRFNQARYDALAKDDEFIVF